MRRGRMRGGRCVTVAVVLLVLPRSLAEERQEDETEHVEGGQERGDGREVERQLVQRAAFVHVPVGQRRRQDHFLRHEAGEQRGTRDRQRRDEEGPVGDRHLLAKTAHVPHQLAVHRVDDGARTEEQARLEERVREQVEHAAGGRTDADRHRHVAELRAGRVREALLQVLLNERDGAREDRREAADERHHFERRRIEPLTADVSLPDEQREHADDHVDARRDHRGGVDERRHGRRAFHGVRQPNVERELRRLGDASHEEEHAREREEAFLPDPRSGTRAELSDRTVDFRERQHVTSGVSLRLGKHGEHDHDRRHEQRVADAVGHEGLLRSVARRLLLDVEADQEVRAQADQFPEDEQDQDVVRDAEAEHREREQRQVGEEARVALFAVHVRRRVEVDERRHERHHDEHDAGHVVHEDRQVDPHGVDVATERDPREGGHVGLFDPVGFREHLGEEEPKRAAEGGEHRRHRQLVVPRGHLAEDERVEDLDRERREGQRHDEEGQENGAVHDRGVPLIPSSNRLRRPGRCSWSGRCSGRSRGSSPLRRPPTS